MNSEYLLHLHAQLDAFAVLISRRRPGFREALSSEICVEENLEDSLGLDAVQVGQLSFLNGIDI